MIREETEENRDSSELLYTHFNLFNSFSFLIIINIFFLRSSITVTTINKEFIIGNNALRKQKNNNLKSTKKMI